MDLEVKLYDVTLNDQSQFGINWSHVITTMGGDLTLAGSPMLKPASGALSASQVQPIGNFTAQQESGSVMFKNANTEAVLKALEQQGTVSVISQPRLRTLNNQTAIMKVGTDVPYYTSVSQVTTGVSSVSTSGDNLSTITIGTVLSITPQISSNGWVTLDITPAITAFVRNVVSPTGLSTAPILDIKQASSIVRLRNGETIVMGGLIQNSSALNINKTPILGDIPLLGKLFQGRFDAKEKKELVIFLTPTVVQ